MGHLYKVRILLVDDSFELREALQRRLYGMGYAIDTASNRQEAEELFRQHAYGLVILDRMLPDGDGLESLSAWKKQGSNVPILMLTARDAVQERVDGLETGADDYLIKPFAIEELLARVAVIARRTRTTPSQIIRVMDVEIDFSRAEVRRAGQIIQLRAKEFSVLAYLCGKKGAVVRREELRNACWGQDHAWASNVDEVAISSLRLKLGSPNIIQTKRGHGYLIDDQ